MAQEKPKSDDNPAKVSNGGCINPPWFLQEVRPAKEGWCPEAQGHALRPSFTFQVWFSSGEEK